MQELLLALRTKYGDIASLVAGQWFQQVRAQTGVTGDDYQPITVNTVIPMPGSVNLSADSLVQQIIKELDRTVKIASRETIAVNCKNDPKKPRYALIPQGKTCAFCLMLASRGYAYKSRRTAHAMHAYCDCIACPQWDKTPNHITGYNPRALSKQWDEAVTRVRATQGLHKFDTVNYLDVLAELRQVRGLCTDGLQPVRNTVKPISARVWHHIIEGDENGKGGHAAWSDNPGKTKFPKDWTTPHIQQAIQQVINDSTLPKTPNIGDRHTLISTVHGVRISVRLVKRKGGWRVVTAYPDADDKRGVKS